MSGDVVRYVWGCGEICLGMASDTPVEVVTTLVWGSGVICLAMRRDLFVAVSSYICDVDDFPEPVMPDALRTDLDL